MVFRGVGWWLDLQGLQPGYVSAFLAHQERRA